MTEKEETELRKERNQKHLLFQSSDILLFCVLKVKTGKPTWLITGRQH
jgi:hypothetical protein